MGIVWTVGILAVLLVLGGIIITRKREAGMNADPQASERRATLRAERAHRRASSGAYAGGWGFFGGDGGGGGFDGGGGCGGDGGGGSC